MKTAIKETIQTGKLIFTKVTTRRKEKQNQRSGRKNPTSQQVQAHNQRYAERDLSIKLHHNFGPGDLHVVLTYSGDEPTKAEAQKRLEKFKRDLAKLYRKEGLFLKWIEVTEYENKRIHHHFVMSRIPEIHKIAEIWPHGYVRPTWLDDSGDYRKLASYLIKETSKTFREPDAFAKRRYHCSRSIEVPVVRIEEVSVEQLFEPKAAKGFQVDQDTVYKGINLATERPYIEFVQVSLEEAPRKYKRGKKTKYRKERELHLDVEDVQLKIDIE